MMRLVYSILISISVLVGAVGINIINSACTCFGGEQVCECSSSCSVEHNEDISLPDSCCSEEGTNASGEKAPCQESGECQTPEFYKLEVPLILVYDSKKLDPPEIELPKAFSLMFSESVLQKKSNLLGKAPHKPPPITRSVLDLSCNILC